MKKLSFLFLLIITLAFIPGVMVKAEDVIYDHLKTFTTLDGDSLSLDRSRGNMPYSYRANLNDKTYIDIDLRGYNWGNLNFFESSKYYIFYGSMMKEQYNFRTQIPFIIRLEKNLSSYKVHFNDSITGFGYVNSMIEFPAGSFVSVENIEGEYYFGEYTGRYSLFSYDEDFNIIRSLDVASSDCTISVFYNLIELKTDDEKTYYFDREFNRYDTYPTELDVEGNFELTTDSVVNDIKYEIGTSFNVPGTYKISDGVHPTLTVNLSPIVEGVKDGMSYESYVEYKVSGGSVSLNDKPVYLNGLVSEVGDYVLKVSGLNGYIKTYSFTIEPRLITDIEDGGTLYIGDELSFTGYATINDGEFITNNYEITTPGTYKISLYASKESGVYKVLYINVPEVRVTKTDKAWAYTVLGLSIAGVGLAIAYLIVADKKRKKKVKVEE